MKQISKLGWLLWMVIFYIHQPGIAQEKMVLTLEKSVTLALEKNPSLRIAEKELAKARAGKWESYANILPQVDFSANFQHAWEIQTSTIPNFLKPMLSPLAPFIPGFDQMPDFVELSFGLENTLRYGATLTQPLFLGGAGLAGIQMAAAATGAAEQSLEDQRQSLIYQTANAFYLCLLARELTVVQEEALSQAQANLDNVVKKYNVGSASGFDKMRAEVEVATLKPEVISTRNNYQSALTQLKAILGLPRETIIEAQGEFSYVADDFGSLPLLEIQRQALAERPVIRALDRQKYIARKGITLARSSFLPKLFFQTEYSYMDMRNDYKFTQDEFSKGFTSALSLQIPIFHGFRSTSQYQKARLDYKMMLDTEKQVYDGIAAETEVAFNKFQEAKQKHISAQQTVELAKEALRLANMMYAEGVNTQLDVLSSQLALTRAKLSAANSLYEYQIARYQVRKASGKLKGILD